MANALDIQIRNLEATNRIKEYVAKKAKKLERFLQEIEETRVELSHAKSARSVSDRQVAQITVRGKGFILRTEERAEDIFTAFDAALEKMERQIERYKGKHYRGRGDGRSAAEAVAVGIETEAAAERPAVVVRRKKFTLPPMNEAEAIEQMRLLGHDNFFVFYNAETNAINVLYRRRDGAFGLIEPEIG